MDRFVLALDIGGTQTRAALVDAGGHMLARRRIDTQVHDGPPAVIARIVAIAREVSEGIPGSAIAGVGVAAPGPVDPWTGIVYNPPNMPGWDRIHLKDLLQAELGVPTYVGNDANLAGLGEHRYGAGVGVSHLVYLTVSTGIGGGVIVAGRLLLGADGLAGEVGHMTLEAEGPRCNCGNIGCLEVLAAGPAVARQGAAALSRGKAPGLSALAQAQDGQVTAKLVVAAARSGDAAAHAIVKRAGFYLGVGVVNLVHLFNPQLVVIGGGFAIGAGEMLFEPVRRTVQERAMPPFVKALRIVPAALGDDAGLMGAAALALERGAPQECGS